MMIRLSPSGLVNHCGIDVGIQFDDVPHILNKIKSPPPSRHKSFTDEDKQRYRVHGASVFSSVSGTHTKAILVCVYLIVGRMYEPMDIALHVDTAHRWLSVQSHCCFYMYPQAECERMIFPWGLRITPVDHVADQMDSVHTDSWSVRKEHKNDMCWKGCSGSDLYF